MSYRPRFLTTRRMAVLDLVSRGFTNEQMAHHLGVTVKTVENHLRTLRELTGTVNSRHLVYKALRRGWITIGPDEIEAHTGEANDRVNRNRQAGATACRVEEGR